MTRSSPTSNASQEAAKAQFDATATEAAATPGINSTATSGSIDDLAKRLDDLEKRRTRHDRTGSPKRRESFKDASKGMKIATEFVCAVLVGTFVGFMIDKLLGTLPWFMLLFFLFGSAAGFKNAYAAAMGEEDDPLAGYKAFDLNRNRDKTTDNDRQSRNEATPQHKRGADENDDNFDPLADPRTDKGLDKMDGE